MFGIQLESVFCFAFWLHLPTSQGITMGFLMSWNVGSWICLTQSDAFSSQSISMPCCQYQETTDSPCSWFFHGQCFLLFATIYCTPCFLTCSCLPGLQYSFFIWIQEWTGPEAQHLLTRSQWNLSSAIFDSQLPFQSSEEFPESAIRVPT